MHGNLCLPIPHPSHALHSRTTFCPCPEVRRGPSTLNCSPLDPPSHNLQHTSDYSCCPPSRTQHAQHTAEHLDSRFSTQTGPLRTESSPSGNTTSHASASVATNTATNPCRSSRLRTHPATPLKPGTLQPYLCLWPLRAGAAIVRRGATAAPAATAQQRVPVSGTVQKHLKSTPASCMSSHTSSAGPGGHCR